MAKNSNTDQAATGETETAALNLAHLENDKPVEPEVKEIVVPDEVKAFVDRAHQYWKATPNRWRDVELHSEKAVTETLKLAKAHAKATGRVFRIKNTGSKTVLTYKVSDASQKAE